MVSDSEKELEVFRQIVSGLSGLDKDTQARILQSVVTFLQLEAVSVARDLHSIQGLTSLEHEVETTKAERKFSDREEMPPKDFMWEKQPRTDIERIACLAYYLTHFQDTAYFKTGDLSKLNTEAAQRKFANPTGAAQNATSRGFLVSAAGGKRQLSAMGEQFVQALPDRGLANEVLQRMKPHRKKKPTTK
jgi:hypothetical protein